MARLFRINGEVEASDEALRKAGLSTLITNEELKKTFLQAATAEAYLSLGDEGREQALEILNNLNLNSLNNSNTRLDPRILNQVKAFAYFQAGKFNEKKNYQYAYDALKASKFNPFDPNIENDILTEQNVENIHWELIKSRKIDINSDEDPIAISFRKHLYRGLKFLLQEDRLQEADQKTSEIMLYNSERKEDGYFTIESLENFSCTALREIDSLWYDYPETATGHFGFRVQKEIWQKNGSPTIVSPIEKWRKFYIDIGWKTEESGIELSKGYLEYKDLGGFEELERSKRGNLPRKYLRVEDQSNEIMIELSEGTRELLKDLYSSTTEKENLRIIILEAVQKEIDISQNERQDIFQGQNGNSHQIDQLDERERDVFYSRLANCNL